MSRVAPVPPPRRSREEAKAESRRRLLEAGLDLIETEGQAGLTTGRIAERAGLAQPTFYVHFAGIDDLLESLLAEVLERWGNATIEARRRNLERPDQERFRETFRIPMLALAAHPRALRVVLASRHDPASAIGRWSADVWEQHRSGLVEDLRRSGFPTRTAAGRRRVEMIADGIMALTTELVLGHVDGRYPDLEEAIDVLVAFSAGYLSLKPEHGPRARP